MALESIALVPSGYKATKVYSQLPVNGNGDFTFDRGTATSVQTRVNKDGLIESVAQDVPRLDYLDGGCPSLLLEPASTNLITYSEDFSNGAWSSIGSASVSTDVILSPDGSVNADKIVSASATSVQGVQDDPTFVSGSDYAISVFAKKSDYDWIRLNTGSFNSVFTNASAWFNISNGTIGTIESGLEAKIEDYGNGWYRCSIVASALASAVGRVNLLLANEDNNNDVIGDGSKGTYLFGAQVEQQSYATSYIPTSGGTADRHAETCNGAGTTAEINSQEGVLYAEIRAIADDSTNRVFSLSDGSANNRAIIYYNSSNVLTAQVYSTTNILQGTLQLTLVDNLDYSKVAFHYKENDLKLYVNGLLADIDTSATMPTGLSELAFDNGVGSANFYGRVKRLSVYDSALNDSQLETLTGFGSFSEMASYLSYS